MKTKLIAILTAFCVPLFLFSCSDMLSSAETVSKNVCVVTLDANGGQVKVPSVTVGKNCAAGWIPDATRNGRTFTEWNTKKDGSGKIFTARTAVTGSMTVYAQWEKAAHVTINYSDAAQKGLTFSNVPSITAYVTYGSDKFSIAVRAHISGTTAYALKGYFTANGDMVADNYGRLQASVNTFTDASGNWISKTNVTLYAKWYVPGTVVYFDTSAAEELPSVTTENILIYYEPDTSGSITLTSSNSSVVQINSVTKSAGTITANITTGTLMSTADLTVTDTVSLSSRVWTARIIGKALSDITESINVTDSLSSSLNDYSIGHVKNGSEAYFKVNLEKGVYVIQWIDSEVADPSILTAAYTPVKDCIIYIYDSTYTTRLARTDDGNTYFCVPSAGTYIAVMYAYNHHAYESYCAAHISKYPVPELSSLTEITPGNAASTSLTQFTIGHVWGTTFSWYKVNLTGGTAYSVQWIDENNSIESSLQTALETKYPSLVDDCELYIYDSSFSKICYLDDGNGGFTPAADGTYYVCMQRYDMELSESYCALYIYK